jgi:hypothetical protein
VLWAGSQIGPGESEHRPAGRHQAVLPGAVALKPVEVAVERPAVDLDHQPGRPEHDVAVSDQSGGVMDRGVGGPARDPGPPEQGAGQPLGRGVGSAARFTHQPGEPRRAT